MLRVLLIDDNPDDRLLAKLAIERDFSDVQFHEIGQPEDLEAALMSVQFDLVITDYVLRWTDGLAVLQAIKARYPDCPVIMYTNSGTQETAVEAMRSGLDDYVVKSPTHFIRLTMAVRRTLERTDARRKAAGLETRFQHLLNYLNVGVYRMKITGELLECNDAFLRLLGLNSLVDISTGQSLEHYFDAEDYIELLNKLKQNGEVRDREIKLKQTDGTQRWVRISKVFSSQDNAAIVDGLIEDISDRKQAETFLRQSEQHSSFLAEASRVLAASLDYRTALEHLARLTVPTLADCCCIDLVDQGLIEFTNPILATVSAEQQALILALRQSHLPFFSQQYDITKVLVTGQPEWTTELTSDSFISQAKNAGHLHQLKQLQLTSYIAIPMIARQQSVGILTLCLFQTHRRYNQADFNIAIELAQRTAIAIDNIRLYQEAQAANRAKDEFLAIVSHELRTPLNSMLGWSQMLLNQSLDPAIQTRALQSIERNARLQKKLIDDILDISRIIQNQLHLDMQPVYLVPVIQAAIADIQPTADAKSIQLETHLDPTVGQVMGDPERLQQIVWNLLSNAVKFTPNYGQVTLYLQQINQLAQITITDTGQGIHPDFLPYVFDRFRQADATKTRTQGGLGLGLAIVRHLVEIHQGLSFATSAGLNQGATFTVQLPIIAPQLIDPPTLVMDDQLPSLKGLKILIVDDDADTRDLLKFVLEECQAQITLATSAAEAIQRFNQSPPTLLISDIGMPDEDGFSLIRRIRALEEDRHPVKAIALTAFAKAEDEAEVLAAGFQQHVAKPVNPFELVAIIAQLIGQGPRS